MIKGVNYFIFNLLFLIFWMAVQYELDNRGGVTAKVLFF